MGLTRRSTWDRKLLAGEVEIEGIAGSRPSLLDFPGMDPYLEDLYVWYDFHIRMSVKISGELNGGLRSPGYAILDDQSLIQVRDPSRGHELITVIEIRSPERKLKVPSRADAVDRLFEAFDGGVHVVLIDLLRDRLAPKPTAHRSAADYAVLTRRARTRDRDRVIAFGLRDSLPRIPIPLREGQPDFSLDLQAALNSAYEFSPYRLGAIDYEKPPEPPLSAEDAAWAEALLKRNPA